MKRNSKEPVQPRAASERHVGFGARPKKQLLLCTETKSNALQNVVRQIRIGGETKAELVDRLAAAKVRVNAAADLLFADDRFKTLQHPTNVEFVQVSVADIGFPRGGTIAQVIEAAATLGLTVCPLELAPHLRLTLLDQEEGAMGFSPTQHRAPPGSITVVSAPLSEDSDTPKGFYLRRITGDLWLRGYTSWPGHVWAPEDVLIFALARIAA